MSVSPPSRPPPGAGQGLDPADPWLDDPDAPPTAEELEAARALAEALEGPAAAKPDDQHVAFADALRSAYAPAELDPARHEALLERALASLSAPTAPAAPVVRLDDRRRLDERRRQAARSALRWGSATGALAAAAAAVLVLSTAGKRSAPSLASQSPAPGAAVAVAVVAPELAPSRSTQELFDEPFARSGGSSARIDRIAQARSRDLRQNRFRRWGVP
ncbi:MAG: hypothetical protein MUF34_02070 [Polyangiaceae bacterium]|jgi:hypothetical protein|nr:hypothetical protein [Polyangiaceae bacterium]